MQVLWWTYRLVYVVLLGKAYWHIFSLSCLLWGSSSITGMGLWRPFAANCFQVFFFSVRISGTQITKKKSCAKKGVCYSDVLDITTSCCYSIITIQRLSLPAQLTLLPGSDLSSFRGFYCSAQLHVRSESSTCFQERIRGFLEKIQFLQTTGSYFSNRCLW